MADIDLQRLIVSLEARLDKYDKGMAKAAGTADKTAKSIESRFAKTEEQLASFGRTFGIALGAGEVARFAREAIKNIAELGDQAKRAGVGVEDLQAAMLAIRRQGGDAGALVAAFSKLNLSLGEAAAKGGDLDKILRANHSSAAALQGDPVKALMTIADLMKNAVTEQDRAVIGSAAFGRNYREILPFLVQGGAAIKDAMQASRALGGIITEEDVKQAERFNALLTSISDIVLNKMKAEVVHVAEEFENLALIAGRIASQLNIHIDPNSGIGELIAAIKWLDQHTNPDYLAGKTNEIIGFDPRTARGSTRSRSPYVGPTDATKVPTVADAKTAADAIKELKKNMDEARDATKGLFHDLIDGLRNGASLTDTLSKAFSNLADKMINVLEDQAVDALLGKKGTTDSGVLGQLLGGMFGAAKGAPSGVAGIAGVATGIPLDIPGVGPPGSAHAPPNNINDYVTRRQIGGRSAPMLKPLPGISRDPYDLIGEVNVNRAAKGDLGVTAVSGTPYDDFINGAARQYGIKPSLLAGLIKQESRFDPNVTNPKSGAMGLTQLMPGTAKELGVNDPYDPYQNIYGGADYLSRQLKASGGDVPGALARYNWGPGNVARNGMGNLPAETSSYITNVQKYAAEFSQSMGTVANTAKQAASGMQTGFAPAIGSIISSVSGIGGAGVGAGIGASGFLNLAGLFTGRAAGGPVSAGMPYMVGEHGPEAFVPRVPGVIVPNNRMGGMGGGHVSVHVTKSPYFDTHVEYIAANGDRQTLATARRNLPDTQARFQKLGTTSR